MLPKKKTVSKQRDRLVRNLNDLYQDEAQGSGMMRRVSRSPFVAPSSSSEATGRKSAPSLVAKSSSSSAAAEEVQQEVQQEDVEVRGGSRRRSSNRRRRQGRGQGRRSICEAIQHF
jgi:hypothetical protein